MPDEAWPQELLVLICRVEGLLCFSLLLKEDKRSTAHLSQSCAPWPSALPVLIAQERFPPQSLLLALWLWASWWQTQHSVYISSCCFASTALFGPSCLPFRGKVSTCGGVYLRINFFVAWLFSTSENPLTPAGASVSCSVTAVLCDSSPLCSSSPAAGCGHHYPLMRECPEPLSCCSTPFPAPQLSASLPQSSADSIWNVNILSSAVHQHSCWHPELSH